MRKDSNFIQKLKQAREHNSLDELEQVLESIPVSEAPNARISKEIENTLDVFLEINTPQARILKEKAYLLAITLIGNEDTSVKDLPLLQSKLINEMFDHDDFKKPLSYALKYLPLNQLRLSIHGFINHENTIANTEKLLALIPRLTEDNPILPTISPARLMLVYVCMGMFYFEKYLRSKDEKFLTVSKKLIEQGITSCQDGIKKNKIKPVLLADPLVTSTLCAEIRFLDCNGHNQLAEKLLAWLLVLGGKDLTSITSQHLWCLREIEIKNPQILFDWLSFSAQWKSMKLLENYLIKACEYKTDHYEISVEGKFLWAMYWLIRAHNSKTMPITQPPVGCLHKFFESANIAKSEGRLRLVKIFKSIADVIYEKYVEGNKDNRPTSTALYQALSTVKSRKRFTCFHGALTQYCKTVSSLPNTSLSSILLNCPDTTVELLELVNTQGQCIELLQEENITLKSTVAQLSERLERLENREELTGTEKVNKIDNKEENARPKKVKKSAFFQSATDNKNKEQKIESNDHQAELK